MSRKHFVAAAKVIAAIENLEKRKEMAEFQARLFAADNPRFDYMRFYAACGINL